MNKHFRVSYRVCTDDVRGSTRLACFLRGTNRAFQIAIFESVAQIFYTAADSVETNLVTRFVRLCAFNAFRLFRSKTGRERSSGHENFVPDWRSIRCDSDRRIGHQSHNVCIVKSVRAHNGGGDVDR